MIKGITFVRPAASAADFEALTSFFSALGFEPGKAWDDDSSRGCPFLAPVGNLEIVDGSARASAGTWIEVTALDDVRRVAARWLADHLGLENPKMPSGQPDLRLTAIEDTFWKSRTFTVEPVTGFSLTFWEWQDPLLGKPAALEGDLLATGMRFAIVVARWNAVITDRLLQGALDCLLRSGAARTDIEIIRVPGAWEIPAAARSVAEARRADAIITLGCLLRGDTAHFEAIYNEVARGIGQSQQETGIPHAFGVLTCDTLEQALDRAGVKSGNKGFEAAAAAMEMVSLGRKLAASQAAITEPAR
ncbi:MAG: 6,7-dimethyl-8-ribityllumazine synthase [Acidobacteriaceae bacterium]